MLSFKPECTVYTYKVCHRTNPLKRVFFDFVYLFVDILVEMREEHVFSLWTGITYVSWL